MTDDGGRKTDDITPIGHSSVVVGQQAPSGDNVTLSSSHHVLAPAPPLALVPSDKILTREHPETVWVVPNLLPVGLGILAGAPKIGKSFLALQLALSVASGGMVFGERGKSATKSRVTGREIEEKTLAISIDWLTGTWQSDGDAKEGNLTERQREILDALSDLGEANIGAIVNAVGQPEGNTHRRLQDLVSRGLVVRTQKRSGERTALNDRLLNVQFSWAGNCEWVIGSLEICKQR